ncbi:hypothetical protein [Paraburkholderia sp.]|uniref:hypothetical protein n=1 Tax=Paraburkholderia sp. TaxID=1926495 RepID=UPI0023A35FB0|nr:hypothetical protein [Paraburkholderia sp.]MDE1184504.1 hypothetical protein [Paraburkholderia sp.]
MRREPAHKSTLGACADLPLEAQLAGPGSAGRDALLARLAAEIGCANDALATASPASKRELILLVECLRAARLVVQRSVGFTHARNQNSKE